VDIRSLRYFISVYEQQSFSAAAKQCFVAQPSISAAVAHLEQELGQELFQRHARGVLPTEEGKQLYPLATQLVGQTEAIKTLFAKDKQKRHFKLGVTKGLGVQRMSLLLKDFTNNAEQLELTLVPPDDTCEARIITREELKTTEEYVPIWQEDYLLAMPMNHPLRLKRHIQLKDLDNLPIIQRAPCSAWNLLYDTSAVAGITLDVRAKIQTIDYAIGLVKAGLGCALVPAYQEILAHTDLVFKPIKGLAYSREIVLAYKERSELVELLVGVVGNHQG